MTAEQELPGERHAKALRDYSDEHCTGRHDCRIPHEAIDAAIAALRSTPAAPQPAAPASDELREAVHTLYHRYAGRGGMHIDLTRSQEGAVRDFIRAVHQAPQPSPGQPDKD